MKPCLKCLLPVDDPLRRKKLVADQPDLCDVCAAGELGEKSGVDADLARGLAALVTGDRRGQTFITSYVHRKGAEQTGAPVPPPMSTGAAAGVAMLGALADLLRERVKRRVRETDQGEVLRAGEVRRVRALKKRKARKKR